MGNNKSSNKQPVAHHPSITEVQRLIDRQNAINNEKVIEALEKLPKFNLKTQDFGSFVDEFNNAQAVLNAKLEVKTAKRVFESLIENEERRLYGQIPEELKRNDDWDGYIKALFDVFHTQAEIRIARRVLTRMEQGSEESVRSFRNRIDNAAGFAYPQSKEERITPSMDAFIFGLRRSLRMKILDRVPENLNKAFELFGIVNELELVLARGAGLFIDATPQFARSNFTGQCLSTLIFLDSPVFSILKKKADFLLPLNQPRQMKHRYKRKIHIYDYALGLFKRNLEDVQAHNNVLSEVSQAMTEMSHGADLSSKAGRALRLKRKRGVYSEKAKRFAEKLFKRGDVSGRKMDPAEVERLMKEEESIKPYERMNAQQIRSYFGTLFKEKKAAKEPKAPKRRKTQDKNEEDEDEDEEMMLNEDDEEDYGDLSDEDEENIDDFGKERDDVIHDIIRELQ
ncbi:hypothetical protein PRIPAC_91039 [Pristionchus pacificus]|uniref:NAD(P)H-hydrate epimerase n=1 Tax=Pristionchus pacificus TaxID=54126 RepID=A0A2A6CWM1_PRIPA|nr:hypothetical protein PRIPAC_91039 [Pristionchus pacificus]|eukprot:PDM82585.1 hypothetical protein PRIPAC_36978 [Pristionchus pacificus]